MSWQLGQKRDHKTGGDAKVAFETQGSIGGDTFSSGENIAETTAWDCPVPGCFGCWNTACFKFIVDRAGGGVGAEFRSFVGSVGVVDFNKGIQLQ
jgi:hypothetical protein